MLQNLTVVEITRLVVLAVFPALILNFILLCGECSLAALHGSVVLSQLALNDIVDLVDEIYAAIYLLLADTGVLVRLILVIVHHLVKVAQVSLQSRPGRLHQVFSASDGLARPRVRNLINLIP